MLKVAFCLKMIFYFCGIGKIANLHDHSRPAFPRRCKTTGAQAFQAIPGGLIFAAIIPKQA
jgi:hypothetical protein